MTIRISPRALLDAILRSDLYSFVQAAFTIVSSGDAFLPNWHLEAITYALSRVASGDINRLIITVPPRHLKSICASVAFPAFLLGRDPTRRIICVSYSDALARKHASDCRALMRSSEYHRLFPRTRISPSKDTETEVMTTARGFRLATSVGGTLTGRGGNVLIIDDPMKPQDAISQAARESEAHWYSNTLLTRLDSKSEGAIIVVMQRLHVDDLVGRLLEQGGWTILNLPAIAETDQRIPVGPGRFHLFRAGEVLHPEREPRSVLDEIKRSMGSSDFAAQYLQDPVPLTGNMINWSWFRRYDQAPTIQPGDRLIVSWDTALTANELSDYSAAVVLLVRAQTAYVLDVVRARLEFPELRRRVIELDHKWRRLCSNYALLIEDKGSGMSLIQDLRRSGIYTIAIKPNADKVIRANAHTAKIEAGAVLVPQHAPWLEDFRREILAFPKGRHNDQVDALSQALERAFSFQPAIAATGSYIVRR